MGEASKCSAKALREALKVSTGFAAACSALSRVLWITAFSVSMFLILVESKSIGILPS